MSSFEEQYILRDPTWWRRTARDVALLANSLRFLLIWATKGWTVRRLLAKAERQGKVVCIEDLFGPGTK